MKQKKMGRRDYQPLSSSPNYHQSHLPQRAREEFFIAELELEGTRGQLRASTTTRNFFGSFKKGAQGNE